MLNTIAKVRRRFEEHSRQRARLRFCRERKELDCELGFSEAIERFPSRDDLFAYMHRYFYARLPAPLRQHRRYFSSRGRGFGEEAFHSMWYLLIREFNPAALLEIGVFRGQVISLWSLIGKLSGRPMSIRCISPFSGSGDKTSLYPDLDYLSDVLRNFRHFGLTPPGYFRGMSTDAAAVAYLRQEKLDCVYIDGSHDFDVVLADYRNSVDALRSGGILVMDDSSLYTGFNPPPFSFAGHPGPSKVAREYADVELRHLAGIGHQNVYRKP